MECVTREQGLTREGSPSSHGGGDVRMRGGQRGVVALDLLIYALMGTGVHGGGEWRWTEVSSSDISLYGHH